MSRILQFTPMTLQPVRIKLFLFIFSFLFYGINSTAQTITCSPAGTTVECNADGEILAIQQNADNIAMLEACSSDDCGTDITVTSDFNVAELINSCGTAGFITVSYTIVSSCEGDATRTTNFNILEDGGTGNADTQTITCEPEGITVDCTSSDSESLAIQRNADNIAMLEACTTDDCADLNVVVTSDFDVASLVNSCGNTGFIVVNYTITTCGTSSARTTNFTIGGEDGGNDDGGNDNTDTQTITCEPEGITVDCTSADSESLATQRNADNIAMLEACTTDGCADVVVEVTSDFDVANLVNSCGNTGFIVVNYTITTCGTSSARTTNFTIGGEDGGNDDGGNDDGGNDDGGNDCGAVGGNFLTLDTDTTEVTVCVGDGISDAVFAKVWEEEGDASVYIITDEDGNILTVKDGISFEFEGMDVGTAYIYHLSTVGTVSGINVGSNISDLSGCHELSNSIKVNKVDDGDQCGCAMFVQLGSDQTICLGESVTLEADVMNSNVCTIVCAVENAGTLVEWDMDACHSITNGVDNTDFSELAPSYPNADECVNVEATHVNVEGGMHSCTVPKDGLDGRAMCFSASKKCYWRDDSPDALKFSVTLTPEQSSTITGLQFYESAPERFTWYNPDFSEDIDEGPNNFPRFYGLRVTKNGEEIFQQNDIPTTNDWTLEEFDFSDNAEFKVEENTTFVFELLAYCPAWRNAITYAWDLDNIKLLGGCCEKDESITKVDYLWSTGDTTKTITVSPTEHEHYSVTVSDCMGCVATKRVVIDVNQPVTADLGGDINVCMEDLPLTLSHSLDGIDTKHPRVEWSTGEEGESIQVTEAGTYSVTITDGKACFDTDEIIVSISEPDPLNLPDSADPVCAGSSIDLTSLEPSGQGGGVWTNANGDVVSREGAGTYTYTYTDSNGCTSSDQITLTEDNFSFTVSDQGPICPDATFDFSTIVPDGVSGDSWEVTDLGDGNYRFTGTNDNGCTASDEFSVSVDNFMVSLDAPPVLCEGEVYMLMDQVPADYTGGTWTDMDGNTVDEATPGMFTYTYTNDNGCTSSDKITFISSGFELIQLEDDSVCWGDSILLSTLELPEQSGGFWKDLNNNVVTYGHQDEFYRYHLFDEVNGCADIVTIKIHEKHCNDNCEGITVSLDTPDAICTGESITLSTLESIGSTGGSWTNSDGDVVTEGGAGSYTYAVTNMDGCTATAQVEIVSEDCVDPCAAFNISFTNPAPICDDATFDLSTLVSSAAEGGEWTNADGTPVTTVGPGVYTYTVTTNEGCSATADVTIVGEDCNDPCEGVSISISSPSAICDGETINLSSIVPSELAGGSWTNADGAEVSDVSVGVYTYTLTNGDGCTASATITIESIDCNGDPCDDHTPMINISDVTICEDDAPYVYVASLSTTCQETITYSSGGAQIEHNADSLLVFTSGTIDVVVTGPNGNSAMVSFAVTVEDCTDPVVTCDDGNPNTENDIQIDDCNCCGTPVNGQVIYVDADAAGAADGTSWADAYTDLQEGMQSAEAGQEIWLADGTYLPTQDGDRDAYFNMPSGVDLYGGFDGSETNICQRDFSDTRSVLSGDLLGDDKIDVENLVPLELLFTGTEENSHYVLRNSQVTDDIKIDGVAITGGVADGTNTAGGGGFLFVNDSDATLEMNNVLVVHNQGAGLGGAGRINTRSATTFTVKMNRVVYLQNQVSGPALSKGGALFYAGYDGGLVDMNITNCLFAQNYSENRGGAICNDDNVRSIYSNSLFAGNKASDGGAIFENNGDNEAIHTNNTFYINFADEKGGAIVNFRDFGSNTIESRNCIFFGNVSTLAGGPGFDNFDNDNNNFSFQNCLFSEADLATIETQATGTEDRGNNQFAADPLFVDPVNADFNLQEGSPAIDAGDQSFVTLSSDLFGKIRVQNGEVDLGANEFGDETTCDFDRFDFNVGFVPPVQSEIEFVIEEEEIQPIEVADAAVTTFPNPTANEINVLVSKHKVEDAISLKLYDSTGSPIAINYSVSSDMGMKVEYNIPVKDFNGGVYILKTKVGKFTINKRVIVIK